MFGTRAVYRGGTLYMSSPEDYYFMLTTVDEGTWGDVPFITDVDWATLDATPIDQAAVT